MNVPLYKYDIAFSFLAQDESTAVQLNDQLQDRFRTFLYLERQKELAGKDGEAAFADVFGREARIVAVLYRPEWGSTPWTRVEQTAIRNRAHDEGYDFTTFIAMTDPISAPPWLPKTRLLYGLGRFGVAGAVGVLDSRVQDAGGVTSEETVIERGQRLARRSAFIAEQDHFRRSYEGVTAAQAAVARIEKDLAERVVELKSTDIHFQYRSLPMGNRAVAGDKVVLLFWWECHYANSLEDAKLRAEFFKGWPPNVPGIMAFDKAPRLSSNSYQFMLVRPGTQAWVSEKTEIPPDKMADHLLKKLMDLEESQKSL